MIILFSLFFITATVQAGTDIQQSKLAEVRQIVTIDVVKDSINTWISNWGVSCRIPERIIESEKKFFTETSKDYTYLLEYVLSDKKDNYNPLYRYLDCGKIYVFCDGKLKKCSGFFCFTEYGFENQILVEKKSIMEVRPFYYSRVNKKRIEMFFKTYQPECFIESGRIDKLKCVDRDGVLRTCELKMKHHLFRPRKFRYAWLYL